MKRTILLLDILSKEVLSRFGHRETEITHCNWNEDIFTDPPPLSINRYLLKRLSGIISNLKSLTRRQRVHVVNNVCIILSPHFK